MKKLHDDVAVSSAEQKNNIIVEQKAFFTHGCPTF
jgi:hypothetical protein